MFCFINLTPQTPPSVIHGWKATDLLYEMVKTKKIFFHPVKRQIFDDAPKQTFYMISKLVICLQDNQSRPDLLCYVYFVTLLEVRIFLKSETRQRTTVRLKILPTPKESPHTQIFLPAPKKCLRTTQKWVRILQAHSH